LVQYEFGTHEVGIRWTDPSLPNLAGRADAVQKLSSIQTNGQPLYTWQELRRKLGDSDAEIKAAEEARELQSVQDLLNQPETTQPNQSQTQGVPNEQGTGTQSG
jgi:hypothetical protein